MLAKGRCETRADLPVPLGDGRLRGRVADAEVAVDRVAVHGGDRFAVHHENALVARADLAQVRLQYRGPGAGTGDELDERGQVRVVPVQPQHAAAGEPVDRLGDDHPVLGDERADRGRIGADHGGRPEVGEVQRQQVLAAGPQPGRGVDQRRPRGIDEIEHQRGGDEPLVERGFGAHEHGRRLVQPEAGGRAGAVPGIGHGPPAALRRARSGRAAAASPDNGPGRRRPPGAACRWPTPAPRAPARRA